MLQNIYALARQAQVIPGFHGPRLGVRFSVSLEDQQKRLQKKEADRAAEKERRHSVNEQQLYRRAELESQKREEMIADMESSEIRKIERQAFRGDLSAKEVRAQKRKSGQFFQQLRTSNEEVVSNSDIKFGMDIDIHDKRKKGYSFKREAEAMDWIEKVTGARLNEFHTDLKSGHILCLLINTIYPGTAPTPGTKDVPLVHRVSSSSFLAGLF